jgi:hypothetical protein
MKWFQRLFKDHLQVIVPFKRPTFTHLTNPKKGYTPPYGVQYYCYKMNLPKRFNFYRLIIIYYISGAIIKII